MRPFCLSPGFLIVSLDSWIPDKASRVLARCTDRQSVRYSRHMQGSSLHLMVALVLLMMPPAVGQVVKLPDEPAALKAARAKLPVLDERSLVSWRDYILPRSKELTWERLPWIASFERALSVARVARRPILLWVMNGHPLGCT